MTAVNVRTFVGELEQSFWVKFVSRTVTAIEQSRMVENVYWDLVMADESIPPVMSQKKKSSMTKSLC